MKDCACMTNVASGISISSRRMFSEIEIILHSHLNIMSVRHSVCMGYVYYMHHVAERAGVYGLWT